MDMSDSNFLLHFQMEKDSFRMLVEEKKGLSGVSANTRPALKSLS
jgi:hypothetical protein